MEWWNFVLMIELLVLFLINGPMYYKIPHNFNKTDLYLDIRNRQGLTIIATLCYRLIDFILIAAGDTTRINSGTCMHCEMFTMLILAWIMWLELVLFVSDGAVNSVKYIKLQILCYICPVLLMAPCMLYDMFIYKPTSYRAVCTFKTPTDAETHQIGISSMVMLLFTVWVPAHALLALSYKRSKWTALTVAAAVVCVLLYLPELFHMMDNNTAASVHASTARSLMFVVMSLYLNTSLAGRTCKDVV